MRRAISTLEIRAVDDATRTITGVASTPSVDRLGDIVDPGGVTFQNPVPLLLYHDSRQPVGLVYFDPPTKAGVTFRATIRTDAESATLRERIAEAWDSIRLKLIRGVSIGFRVLDDGIELIKDGGLKFTSTEILELSLVSVPANQDATISTIRSICQRHVAPDDAPAPQQAGTPGVTGAVVRQAKKDASPTMKTYTEQIKGFEATRQAKDAERAALMNAASEKGETLDPAAAEQYDGLSEEIKSLDAHLGRLRHMETEAKAAAVVVAGDSAAAASAARGGTHVISIKENRPAGIGLARVAIAQIVARKSGLPVTDVIKSRWPSDSEVLAYVTKATIPAGLTTYAAWAGNLVDQTNLSSEFIEFLRPQTIIGRLPLRRVPFNIRVTGQTTGAVANWVGEGKPKPVTSFNTNAQTLLYTKIAAIAVITEELARFSSPDAEALVRDELARAVIERMDIDFIDPAHAAVTGVNPASITNGLTALSSAGTSADNIRTDLQNLLEYFLLNNQNASNVVLIMPNTLALAASLLTNAFGQPEFPSIGINGGSLRGIPVVTSQYAANQSGSGNLVIALDPTAIFLAADDSVMLDASREASIQMSDAPTNDAATGTGQSLVSMYQTNSIAIRAERFINWAKMRSTAVVYMDDVNWGSIGSPS